MPLVGAMVVGESAPHRGLPCGLGGSCVCLCIFVTQTLDRAGTLRHQRWRDRPGTHWQASSRQVEDGVRILLCRYRLVINGLPSSDINTLPS